MVRVVLELQVYRGLHTGGFEGLLGLGRIRLAGTVAIGFLQGVVVAGQAIRNEGVQRGVGALVDLGGQLVAVDQACDGLTHGLGLVGVRLAGLLAVRHDLEVEGKEALFAARSLDDLDLVVLGQVLDVGRGHGAVGHVDLALLHGHLQVGGIGEVLDLHNVVLSWGQTLVGNVLGICQGLVHLVGGELVRACEGVVLDDGVGIGQLVGGEGLFVDDRAGRAGEHLLQGHVVLDRGVEHDGGVILGLDGLDVGQQGGRTVLVVDLLDTVEGELDVGGGQIVAVRELQALLELDGELGAVGAPGAVIGGDVRRQLGSVVVLRVQEREHLNLHGVGTVVVGASRIKAGDLIGRADGDGVASCGATVLHAAAGGQGSQSRDRSQSGDNFLAIHYGILSFLSESPLCKAI